MASRKPYECFRCQDNGYPDTLVFLAGKDEQGKTIQLEEDGSKHIHKTKSRPQEAQPIQEQKQPSSSEYEKSVDNGISAFSMITSLIGLVEQNQKLLVTLNEKVEHLTKLVYAATQSKPQQQQQK